MYYDLDGGAGRICVPTSPVKVCRNFCYTANDINTDGDDPNAEIPLSLFFTAPKTQFWTFLI